MIRKNRMTCKLSNEVSIGGHRKLAPLNDQKRNRCGLSSLIMRDLWCIFIQPNISSLCRFVAILLHSTSHAYAYSCVCIHVTNRSAPPPCTTCTVLTRTNVYTVCIPVKNNYATLHNS